MPCWCFQTESFLFHNDEAGIRVSTRILRQMRQITTQILLCPQAPQLPRKLHICVPSVHAGTPKEATPRS